MDFSLSETELLLQSTAQRFLRERYSFEARKKIVASSESSNEIWRSFADLGLLGIGISEAHGGNGGDFQQIAVIAEQFGRSLVNEPYLANLAGAWLLERSGSASLQEKILPLFVEGRVRIALAHSENGTRYNLAAINSAAERTSAGYRISGKKTGVIGADTANMLLVSARTAAGVSLFAIDSAAPGVSVRPYRNFDDTPCANVEFESVLVGRENILGNEDEGLPLIAHAFDRAIAALCWDAVGAMTALNEVTLDYLKTRVQFGRPIGKFQVLQHRMVDMTIAAEQARSMAILATDRADWTDAAARAKDISAAKVAVAKGARTVGQGAIQLHGGMGLTMEYIVSHYFKRLTAFELMLGDSEFHLARFRAS